MAARHNAYAQLLGTVENNPQPLVGAPVQNMPDLGDIADRLRGDADYIVNSINDCADKIEAVGQLLPDFQDALDTGNNSSGNGGGY